MWVYKCFVDRPDMPWFWSEYHCNTKGRSRLIPAATQCFDLFRLQDLVNFSNIVVEILPKNTRIHKCKHLEGNDLKVY